MKRILPIIILTSFIFVGVSMLIFVVITFKNHSNSMGNMMGMMMRKEIIYYYLVSWMKQMFWISLIIIGMMFLLWAINNSR